jgi:hypothetical protein
MPLTVAESVAETADNFVSRTLSFATPAAIGVRVAVSVNLYTTTGVAATAGMISDPGGHTWTRHPAQTGDGSTGGVAIISTVAVSAITSVTLTPGGSGNYCAWSISRTSGPADVDDFEVGSGSSTSPAPAAQTSTTTDAVAISVISTRNQSANQTPPSGWTAIHLEKDNSAHLATGIARSPNITSTGSVPAVWTSADGGQWYAAAVLFKASATLNHYTLTADGGTYAVTGTAATLVAPRRIQADGGTYTVTGAAATLSMAASVYLVMGGTEDEGWFGSEAKGGADSVATITFDPPVPTGAAIVVTLIVYQFNPTLSEISDDGGNTWTILQRAATIGGGSVEASVSQIRSVLTSPCSVFTYDATALPGGDAGRYGQLGAYVFSRPDTANGFFTVTPASNTQTTTSSVAPGTATPDTNRSFGLFAGNNRGHTTDLKPYTKPSGYTDAALIHSEIDGDGAESAVHNSTTQSGWWFGKFITTETAETPTFGFATTTGGALSVFAIYNLLGGLSAAVLDADAGSYTQTGTAASLEVGREVGAAAGTYAVTGTAATLRRTARVSADGGSYAVVGTAATLKRGYQLVVDAGLYAVTGTGAGVLKGSRVTAAGGSYAVSGSAASVVASRLLVALNSSYAVSGTTASLEYGRLLGASSGVYAFAGSAASLLYSGASSTYTLTADVGTYALTGSTTALRYHRVVSLSGGVYLLSGNAATLLTARLMSANAGAYLLDGEDIAVLAARRLIATAGSYTLTGQDAGLSRTRVLLASEGVYLIVGTGVTFSTTSDTFFIPRSVIGDAVYRDLTRLTAKLGI